MRVGKVIGNVWATKKDEDLEGLKLLVVEEINPKTETVEKILVAADQVGAGPGETVLLVSGSTARLALTRPAPTDTTIVGIIDKVEIYED